MVGPLSVAVHAHKDHSLLRDQGYREADQELVHLVGVSASRHAFVGRDLQGFLVLAQNSAQQVVVDLKHE